MIFNYIIINIIRFINIWQYAKQPTCHPARVHGSWLKNAFLGALRRCLLRLSANCRAGSVGNLISSGKCGFADQTNDQQIERREL